MRRNNHKFRGLVGVLLLVAATALAGCGKGDDRAASGKGAGAPLSRAEYIGMLGEGFGYDTYISETDIFSDVSSDNEYYPEIQAAAEWEIVDGNGSFEPDKAATLEFALEAAVRAIGTEDIEASGAEIDRDNLAGFYAGNIAQADLSDADASIDVEMARQIIEYARNYDLNLTLPQVVEIELAEGVKTAGMGIRINADGATGVLDVNAGYAVGDIVYLDATDTSLARAVKITGIEGQTFTFEDAPLEDTYASLNIQGTFQGKVVEAVSASDGTYAGLGQEIYDEMKAYNMAAAGGGYEIVRLANSAKVDSGGDHMVFTADFDVKKSDREGIAEASSKGKLVIGIKNIRADVTYKSGWLGILNPQKLEFKLHYDTEISTEIHGSAAASIPLGEAYIQVCGPFNVKVMLTAHLGADGNVSVSYTTENVLSIAWQRKGGIGKNFDSKADINFEADTMLTAEATLLADLRLGYKKISFSLANAQITSGAVAAAKVEADLMGDQPTCVDLQLYVPLKWGVNQSGCLITDINKKWKYSAVIWDSGNSPIKIHRHLEDWIRTPGDVCTRTDAVEQELTTPEGEPLEEIDPFDFEPLEFDFIELASYAMYLGEGESLHIGFDSIPEGYTQADLRYEVLDPSVCSVSNGTVKSNHAGSTIVKISTGDGMFMVTLAVTVNEDYSVEGFQEL